MRKKRRRFRFPPKINEDTMTSIVIYSLGFCVAVVVTGLVFCWFGRDASEVVSSALAVFGTELGICGVMKIFDKRQEMQEKREEERRERRREAEREKAEFLEGAKK